MDHLERSTIESACRLLIAKYCHAVDTYDHRAVMEVWSPEPVYESPTGLLRGQPAIRQYFDTKPTTARGAHLLSTILIDVTSTDRARGLSYMTFFVDPNPPAHGPAVLSSPKVISRLSHVFVRTAEGWKIEHQRVEVLFGEPFQAPRR